MRNPYVEDMLAHEGVGHLDGGHSGRYQWGSGENPFQHADDFLNRIRELRTSDSTYTDANGKKWTGDAAIAKMLGLSTTEFRIQESLAKDEKKAETINRIERLRNKGLTDTAIAKELGMKGESSVRSIMNPLAKSRERQAINTANILEEQVKEKGMIDVGKGVEKSLNISPSRLSQALYIMELKGYKVFPARVPNTTNKNTYTTLKVLATPEHEQKDVYEYDKIKTIDDYKAYEDGQTFKPKFVYPKSLDSKRLKIVYAEEGGTDRDGLVQIRRGVKDLSLGESHYSQVRIMVDDNYYIKGMATYGEDELFPPGVDIIFNSNKPKAGGLKKALKELNKDKNGEIVRDNPFKSLIKPGVEDPNDPTSKGGGQSYYRDDKGDLQLSLINKRADEGDWTSWGHDLPSQFLSKQDIPLIKRQIGLSTTDRIRELEEIKALTNPTVKHKLLIKYAEGCDKAAVELKAKALPREQYQVILPVPSLKNNEIYAPNYKDGEKVALVRYPHGGTFEIPILTVNNKNPEAVKMIPRDSKDAVGINHKTAERLSGADFDGDTVMVIPTGGAVEITSTPALKGLEGFDPSMAYPERPGMRVLTKARTQTEMGIISNLITDMTLIGADPDELARAVKHSMVVIDAAKHRLDYTRSESDNDIASLKRKYQKHIDESGKVKYGGASTLISRASRETLVIKRQGSPRINPETGELEYKTSDRSTYTQVAYYIPKVDYDGNPMYNKDGSQKMQKQWTDLYTDKNGKHFYMIGDKKAGNRQRVEASDDAEVRVRYRTEKSTEMMETKDARLLSSGTEKEAIYADYANKLKSLANEARLESLKKDDIPVSKTAQIIYADEIKSLNSKLDLSQRNAPRERLAQRLATAQVNAQISQYDDDLDEAEKKKIKQRAITKARADVGAERRLIDITEREWEAIQAGAITKTKLQQIMNYVDDSVLKSLATPIKKSQLSNTQVSMANAMRKRGYTNAQIAERLNVSTSTIANVLERG